MTALSVLDLVPVRSDQTTGDAIAASRSLAQVADELGYRRYWVAEHHNMPAVAATNPPVLIAMLAAATERIRVGSGGVMLPNHAPLVVAEQFALLEAAHPGRIDLGIGRAPGTDPLTRYVLRGGSAESADEAVSRFAEYVEDVRTLMTTEGVELQVGPRRQPLRATPAARTRCDDHVIGQAAYDAQPGNAERPILVVAFAVGERVGGLRDSPGHLPLPRVVDLVVPEELRQLLQVVLHGGLVPFA